MIMHSFLYCFYFFLLLSTSNRGRIIWFYPSIFRLRLGPSKFLGPGPLTDVDRPPTRTGAMTTPLLCLQLEDCHNRSDRGFCRVCLFKAISCLLEASSVFCGWPAVLPLSVSLSFPFWIWLFCTLLPRCFEWPRSVVNALAMPRFVTSDRTSWPRFHLGMSVAREHVGHAPIESVCRPRAN